MTEEMTSIPPRLNALEQGVHTLSHQVSVLEDTHKETPHRLTKVEIAVERLPQIEARLAEQGDMIKLGFFRVQGMLFGAAALWALYQLRPQIMQFLGGGTMKLIDDAKQAHRLWSVRLAVLSVLLGALELALPLWQGLVPTHVFAALSTITIAAAAVARVIKQEVASND